MIGFDDIVWRTLAGAHLGFSTGTEVVRRYAPGFSPIVGFANRVQPDLGALSPYCKLGEHLYCDGWSGPPPNGWRVEVEDAMLKMVWDMRPVTDEAPEARRLGPDHVDQVLALVERTRPGPFGPRTLELGDYFGCFDDGRLVAMAGERLYASPLREISGVCTDPAYQGRGFARRLMTKLIRREMARGETPCLHVMRGNATAIELYRRMGFRRHAESVVRVIAREAS